jgi:polygalacturonase
MSCNMERMRKRFAVMLSMAIVLICQRAWGADAIWRITDYGAVADGKTLNTEAFAKAIGACSEAGGGKVVVPAGTFLTGPIELKSNVDLDLDENAIVLFSRNFDDYPLARVGWEGRDTVACKSPISGENLHDISITGKGIIDAQGDGWRLVQKAKLSADAWDALVKSGGVVDTQRNVWYPSEIWRTGQFGLAQLRAKPGTPNPEDYEKYKTLLRPALMLLTNCHGVVLNGPTFRNSPSWNIHLLLSDDITVRDVTIFNPIYAQNGDGIDIDSCRNVLLTESTISAGDDDICLKSGRDAAGRELARATENVTISNCVVNWGHGGVAIGSEMSGGIRNVNVSNCIFKGTDCGLRFKTTRGRGGTVENISVTNVTMSDIRGAAILLDMYYMIRGPHVAAPLGDGTPVFRQFQFRNITCNGAVRAIVVHGLPELPIEGLTFEGLRLSANDGVEIMDAKDIVMRDVQVQSKRAPAMTTQNLQNLTSEMFSTTVNAGLVATSQPLAPPSTEPAGLP